MKSSVNGSRYAKHSQSHSEWYHSRRRADTAKFTFLDLFAGIGGIRLALEGVGGSCVFSSEWDPHCQETYRFNFGEVPHGDINSIPLTEIPHARLLAGGFPCQPFSSIGRREGFQHKTQGNLFFRIIEILEHFRSSGQPIEMILLENVEGLTTLMYQGEKVIDAVRRELESVGYEIDWRVLDAVHFGVPQHRRRVYIVGVDREACGDGPIIDWEFPKVDAPPIGSLLEVDIQDHPISNHLQKVYISKKQDGRPQRINRETTEPVKTLVSTYHKIQRLTGTFVEDGPTGLRLLTRRECRDIMGFPREFEIPAWVSRTQAYRQFGNSVTPPVVEAIAERLVSRGQRNKKSAA
jgi:DNA (cytosine-5)-methyltransferase 1